MGVIAMRRVPLLIILILIIGSLPPAAGTAVSEPVQRDVFLYNYFSKVLIRFEYSLKYALLNESYGLKLANLTLNELELINQESLYYRERGVNSTVMVVIPPFHEFAQDLLVLTRLTLEFHRNPSPELAAGILGTVDDMEKELNAIDLLKLRNGTKVLTFNTKGVRKELEKIRNLASSAPPGGGFLIGVSTDEPILHQTITIFGSCPGNDTVTIVIEGGNSTVLLPVTPSNGFFSKSYRFSEIGTYRIHATQGGNSSNTVEVRVRKIPTRFIVDDVYSSLINHTVTLSGRLVDYYGEYLGGREIKVGNETLKTGPDGGFSREYFSPTAGEFTVLLRFAGDEEHEGTSKKVRIVFSKYPVSITLTGPSKITLGKTATFRGTLEPKIPATLVVYVNGTEHSRIESLDGNFTFTLKPDLPGEFEVYVKFPGSLRYGEAESNTVILSVVPPESAWPRYAAIAVLGILLVAGTAVLRRRGEGKAPSPEGPEEIPSRRAPVTVEEWIEVPEDVGEAYTLLRKLLAERLGVGENLTPREVLRALGGWELYPELERVTLLHEKAVYGELPLSGEELVEFRENIERLVRGLER
ncbi:DUF4129 domain-containing protein [Thermococcus cleftensis]|nr:DUF4129 domain-containing protein [Thermococcus cleftensis]